MEDTMIVDGVSYSTFIHFFCTSSVILYRMMNPTVVILF